jgi:peptide/nickel transport system permease protein
MEIAASVSTPDDATTDVRRASLLRRILHTTTGKVGFVLTFGTLFLAIFGPAFSPHSITAIVGSPFQGPSSAAPLGTDYLGRDVLSRLLHGGRLLPAAAIASASIAYVVGAPLGLVAGYRKGLVDTLIGSSANVLLSIPTIVAALILIAGFGGGVVVLILAIAFVMIAPVVRIVRSLTIEAATNEYVEAAVARGEPARSILLREILPNLRGAIGADFGVRVAWSAVLFAALNFLGFGESPPAADWGVMISENRYGLLTAPLGVVAPAIAIAAFVVGVNFMIDSWVRSWGGTLVSR